MTKKQPDEPSQSPYASSDPEVERMYQASAVSKDELLAQFDRQARRMRWSMWLRDGWRDTLAGLFSREAREEQRQWKREREESMAAFRAEQDAIYEKIRRKVDADMARREGDER